MKDGRIERFYENSPVGFCALEVLLDAGGSPVDFQVIDANQSFFELEGRPKEQLLYQKIYQMNPGLNPHFLQRCYESACQGKVRTTRRPSFLSDRYLCITRFPLEEGICGCVIEDITNQHQHEQEEEKYFDMIQGLSSDYYSLHILDMEQGTVENIRMMVPPAVELGKNFEQQGFEDGIQSYARRYVYEADRERMLKETRLERIRQELLQHSSYCVNYRRIDGEKLEYLQIKFNRIEDETSVPKVAIGLQSVEEEVKREMEQKAIIEEALLQARQASKAKTDFLSNMSHDIRTPMNAIIGFAAIAAGHIDNQEKVKDCLTKIMASSNHLLALINDVLDMSRIESGKIQIQEQPANLSDIMHDFMNMIQPQVELKNQELYIDTMDVLHEDVYVDIQRLERVLINIAGNAVKYTDLGGTISIRLKEIPSGSAGQGRYVFSIRDNGIGMSEEFLPHVFEVFERERNSTISKVDGTGLGLPIAKNIVELMGGMITVTSEKDKGTEFVVTLPLRLQEESADGARIERLAGLRAMVVDDDFNVCDSVSRMLTQIGMEPDWTLSGKEAVLKAQQAKETGRAYYAYIVDWMLPDTDGIEIIRQIRRIVDEDTPIYVLTAYDYSDIEEEARAAGVTAFWQKPLFMSSLRSVLLRSCGEQKTQKSQILFSSDSAFQGKKLLLAEDNELNREIAMEILQEAGFIVDTVENGKEALNKIQASKPGDYDLVLMDIQMPVMNGYEATRAIRSLERKELANLPILAMTANAFEEDKQRAIECGMNGHISKPLEMNILFSTLRDVFSEG